MPFFRSKLHQTVTGANVRIRLGLFGNGTPAAAASFEVNPTSITPLYSYAQGDLFTPGAMNFVFEPNFELPLQTVWGFGFIRNPNTFSVRQPTQAFSNPVLSYNGLGGQMAGQMATQPLMSNDVAGGG